MDSASNAIKVGLTVIAAVIMAIVGYMVLNNISMMRDTHEYSGHFDNALGVKKGMPVRKAGVDVGFVASLQPDELRKVEAGVPVDEDSEGAWLTMKINKHVQLYSDYRLVIRQDGLFGDRFISIDVPPQERRDPQRRRLEPGSTLIGYSEASINTMISSADEVLNRIGTVVESDFVEESVGTLTASLEVTLENVNELVLLVKSMLAGEEGNLSGSMQNVHAITENFLAMSETLNATATQLSEMATSPEQQARMETILANLESISNNLATITDDVGGLTSDPQLQQDIKDSVRLTKETLEETKNTVVQFQGTLEHAESMMDEASGLMGNADGAIDEARDKMEMIDRAGDAIEIKLGLNVRAVDKNDDQNLDNEDVYVGDLNAAVGYDDTYVYFGADDIGEENNFNLMMGYGSLSGFSFRGGVYRGELGLGAAYYGDFGAEVTMYDTEDPKVNAYGYIPITEQLNIVVGGEDLGNDPVASVGIGVDLE